MKNGAENYFHFTKKERTGIVVILVVVMLLVLVPFLYPFIFKSKPSPLAEHKEEFEALRRLEGDSASHFTRNNYKENDRFVPGNRPYKKYEQENLHAQLFYFDPNILSSEEWQKLGIKEKTATGILHYIEKGGKFRQPEDLKKIWGISEEMAARLQPYVRITEKANNIYSNKNGGRNYEKKEYEKKIFYQIDINASDTAAFISLPGIGSKLAQRIVGFREKLGGFYSIAQLSEVFGLPDSTFQKIRGYLKISVNEIKKININSASLEEMKQHPYIRWQLAAAIIQFRTQHGNFAEVEDVKKIMLVTEEIFTKLQPYLTK